MYVVNEKVHKKWKNLVCLNHNNVSCLYFDHAEFERDTTSMEKHGLFTLPDPPKNKGCLLCEDIFNAIWGFGWGLMVD